MSVGITDNRFQYEGDGIVDEFPFPAVFFETDWIDVFLTDDNGVDLPVLQEGIDYTVEGVANPAGGKIITTVPVPDNFLITLNREAPYTQEDTLEFNGPLPSGNLELVHDKNVILIQQLREIAQDLALQWPVTEPLDTPNTLPDRISRRGKALRFSTSAEAQVIAGDPVDPGLLILLSEDDMASNDPVNGATQRSIKNHVAAETNPATSSNQIVAGPVTTTAGKIPFWDAVLRTLVDGLNFHDEDDMVSDDPLGLASQQSIKAFGDNITSSITAIIAQSDPLGIPKPCVFNNSNIPAGFISATVPGSIGSAASGATLRANEDARPLFTIFWDNVADAQAPVSGGRGASADADFDADKTLTVPSFPGRAIFALDDGNVNLTGALPGGLDGSVICGEGGDEQHQITLAEMAAHGHSISGLTLPEHVHSDVSNTNEQLVGDAGMTMVNVITALNPGDTGGVVGLPIVITGSIGSAGGDTAHNNVPPGKIFNWMYKL